MLSEPRTPTGESPVGLPTKPVLIRRAVTIAVSTTAVAASIGFLTYQSQHDVPNALVAAMFAGMTALTMFLQILSK